MQEHSQPRGLHCISRPRPSALTLPHPHIPAQQTASVSAVSGGRGAQDIRAPHYRQPSLPASSLPERQIPGKSKGILSPFLGMDSALVLVPGGLTQTCKREGHRLLPGNSCPAPPKAGDIISYPLPQSVPALTLLQVGAEGPRNQRTLSQTCSAPGCTHLPLRPSSSQDHMSLQDAGPSQQAHCEEEEGGGGGGSGAAQGLLG